MAPKRNKRKSVVEDEFGSKDLPYRTSKRAMKDAGVYPVRQKSRKVQDMASWIIKIFTTVMGVFLIVALASALTANGRLNSVSERVEAMYTPAFKARYDSLGKTIIEAYFSGGAVPTNLLSTVTWRGDIPGSSSVEQQGASVLVDADALSLTDAKQVPANRDLIDNTVADIMVDPIIEVLTYTGVIDGRQYKFGISLLIPDVNNPEVLPYLMYNPSIMPMDTLLALDTDLSQPPSGTGKDYVEFQATDAILSAVDNWATAYAQDDRESLKRITGDSDPTRQYSGVGGFTLRGTPSVLWSFAYMPNDEETDIAILRVNFDMIRQVSSGRETNDALAGRERNNTFVSNQTMDIMIHKFTQGTPNIVAWTHAGNWSSLNSDLNVEFIDPESTEGSNNSINSNVDESTTNTTPPAANVPSLTRTTNTPERSDSERTSSSTRRGSASRDAGASARTSSRSNS